MSNEDSAFTERLREVLRLEEYGIGVPFVFGVVGIALVYAAAPGLANFTSIYNYYTKLGIVVVSLLAAVSLSIAGYTYRAIDIEWWILSEDDPDADPDLALPEGEDDDAA